MPAYALNRLFVLGCGKVDAFFWLSTHAQISTWHTHSYCYPRLNRLILQRTTIHSWIYVTCIFSVLCSAKMDLDIILYCLKLQHNLRCLQLLRISYFPPRKKGPWSFLSWSPIQYPLQSCSGDKICWGDGEGSRQKSLLKDSAPKYIFCNFNYILPN